MRFRTDAYLLQLLHGGFVGLSSAEHVGPVTVAVLCVGMRWSGMLREGAQGIVLLWDMVSQVWRDHLFEILRGSSFHKRILLWFIVGFVQVSRAVYEAFMVVALQQSGVRIGGDT